VISFAGTSKESEGTRRIYHRTFAGDVTVALELNCAAGALLRDWPHPFNAMLKDILVQHFHNPVTQNLRSVFGLFLGQMNRLFKSNEFGFLHDAFGEFIARNWTGIERGKFFSKVTRENSRWIPTKEVAGLIRACEVRVVELVKRGELDGVFAYPGKPGSQCWITRESLSRWIQKRDSEIGCYISNLEASKILGLQTGIVLMLAKAGLIRYRNGSQHGFPHDHYFHRDDVINIRDAFERYSVSQRQTSGRFLAELVTLRHGLPVHLGWQQVFPAAIRAVVDGTLVPVAYTKRLSGISRFLFQASHLRQFYRELQGRMPAGGYVNCTEAASILATTTEVIRKLAERGILHAPTGTRGSPRLLPMGSLCQFARRYVPVSLLAEHFHTSCPRVHQYLKSRGIDVLTIPLNHQCKLFVPRSAVTRIHIPPSKRVQNSHTQRRENREVGSRPQLRHASRMLAITVTHNCDNPGKG